MHDDAAGSIATIPGLPEISGRLTSATTFGVSRARVAVTTAAVALTAATTADAIATVVVTRQWRWPGFHSSAADEAGSGGTTVRSVTSN
ncbi:hypothetical protein GCM10023192_15900 [Amycolatopsis samaneae]